MKNNIVWIWLGFAISVPALVQTADAKVARGTPARTLALSGTWHYTVDENFPAASIPSADTTMKVPSNWYQQGLEHSGIVWFAREVDVPDDGAWRLEFDGVDYRCEVYWDGIRIGGHTGYFAPFRVPVPAHGGRHELAVRVDSPSETTASWSLHKLRGRAPQGVDDLEGLGRLRIAG